MNLVKTALCRRWLEKLLSRDSSWKVKSATSWSGFGGAGRSRPVADGGIWLRNRGFPALPKGAGRGFRLRFGLPRRMEPVRRRRTFQVDLPSRAAADVPCNSFMSLSLLVHLPNYNRPKAVLH